MADTAPSRPRPRPRPRQKAKSPVKPSATTGDGASSSSTRPSPLKTAIRNEADLDAMFMKNRNRSTKNWQKLEEIKKDDPGSLDGSNSESDENVSPRSRKRVRKRVEALPKPKWQGDKELLRLLSAEPDSNSDSDDSDDPNSLTILNGKKRDGKRKRLRSRSRSITPPPQLPLQQVENVKKFVRQAMGEVTHDFGDNSTDTIILDPDLARGYQPARQKTPLQFDNNASGSNEIDEDDKVHIIVNWKAHPRDPNGQDLEWEYQTSRHDNFRELFEAIAEDASIRVENLVVCHQGKRIFASVSPNALNIWKDAQFTAYSKPAFEYIRANPEPNAYNNLEETQPQTQAPPSPSGGYRAPAALEIDSEDERPGGTFNSTAHAEPQSQSEAEDDDDKFKLNLRSALTGSKDIVLTVRPTTKCGNILKAFLKKAGLADQYPEVFADQSAAPTKAKKGGRKGKAAAAGAPPPKDPRLCVDGDKLDNDSPIAEAELEDGDLVEVVGL